MPFQFGRYVFLRLEQISLVLHQMRIEASGDNTGVTVAETIMKIKTESASSVQISSEIVCVRFSLTGKDINIYR